MLLNKIGQLLDLNVAQPKATTIPTMDALNQLVTIDLQYLYDFSNGDRSFVKDMVMTFVKDAPVSFQLLQDAYAEKNWEVVSKTAHRLKPNFMMLGMKAQQAIALEIEQQTKKEQFDEREIQRLILALEQATQQAYPLLERKLQEI